jgi:hypothetical protein
MGGSTTGHCGGIKIDFALRSLRDDARYEALVRKMNLPQ